MTINAVKFANFMSLLTMISQRSFNMNECDSLAKHVEFMIEVETTAPAIPVLAEFQQVDDLMKLMMEGTRKIEAIKAYRQLTGLGLKESKDAVERYWVDKRNDLEEVNFEG